MAQRITLWLIDGALLGLFMVSVGVFSALIYSPRSPLCTMLPSNWTRGVVMGLAMGLTAVALIYSPLGGRSGAHMNPAVTIAFLWLSKIRPFDAAGYIAAQFAGGLAGTVLIGAIIGPAFTDAPVSYAPTVPGEWGAAAAAGAEFLMTFIMMIVVLVATNHKTLARYAGLFAGSLLTLYIVFEAPVSGMSINPARTLASALPSGRLDALGVYLFAPTLGMLAGAEVYRRLPGAPAPHCCKLNHDHPASCPHCGCDGPINFDAHRSQP